MSARPEVAGVVGTQRLSARDVKPRELATAVAEALRNYPYFIRVNGFERDDDPDNVKRLAKLIAEVDDPESKSRRVSFTRVCCDAKEAARRASVTRFSRTAQGLPLHTDSSYLQRPHELVAFQMVIADEHGGETLLATAKDILRQLDEEVEKALREPAFRFTDGNYPVLTGDSRSPCIRYYRRQLECSSGSTQDELSGRHRRALDALDTLLSSRDEIFRFFLESGEILFLNNLKVMHGRTSFPDVSPRLMYRVRLHARTLQEMPEFDLREVRRLIRNGKPEHAIALCRARIERDDTDVAVLLAYGRALRAANRHRDAIKPLRKASEVAPDDPDALKAFGNALLFLGRNDEAIDVFRRHRELAPQSYSGGLALSALLRKQKKLTEARQVLASVIRKHPYRLKRRVRSEQRTIVRVRGLNHAYYGIIGRRSTAYRIQQRGGHFSVNHLLDEDPYNILVFSIFEDNINRIDLPHSFDLILNTISCPDLERQSLLSLARFCAHNPEVPIINHPRRVLDTARDRNCLRFSGIKDIEFPLTERLRWTGENSSAMVDEVEALGFSYPIIVRRAGSQTGSSVRRCENADGLRGYFDDNSPDNDYYAIQFSDFRANHGFYNKMRMFCIDGSYYPVASIFVDNWSVHSGDRYRVMDKHQWMQDEEHAFLTDPTAYLGSEVFGQFAKIRDIVKLDFFGMDFARRDDGSILLFELNPAMRHNFDHAGRFPYTKPHLERVSRAFEQMVKWRLAGSY